jgi:hypothetical protein
MVIMIYHDKSRYGSAGRRERCRSANASQISVCSDEYDPHHRPEAGQAEILGGMGVAKHLFILISMVRNFLSGKDPTRPNQEFGSLGL